MSHADTPGRGREGDEVEDVSSVNMANPRRRSNSSSAAKSAAAFKTKFETIEAEPVFEMSEHGPLPEEDITTGVVATDPAASGAVASARSSQDSTGAAADAHRLQHVGTA